MQRRKKLQKRAVWAARVGFITTLLIQNLTAALISLPYVTWKLLVSKRRKGNFISRIFRKVLEMKKTKQVVGVNLAGLLMAFTVIQFPAIATEALEADVEPAPIQQVNQVLLTESTFRSPVPGYISQHYSWYHPGIDIAGNDNSIVYPVAPGKVVQIEYGRFGYGISVMVDHGDNMISRYAHLKKVSVELDQEVTKETAIGYVGSTGWSTGPHLHLEIYQNGSTLNPTQFFPSEYSTTYVEIPAPAVNTTIASAPTGGSNSVLGATTATISAEITYKQVSEGFEEPFPYQYTATASAEAK